MLQHSYSTLKSILSRLNDHEGNLRNLAIAIDIPRSTIRAYLFRNFRSSYYTQVRRKLSVILASCGMSFDDVLHEEIRDLMIREGFNWGNVGPLLLGINQPRYKDVFATRTDKTETYNEVNTRRLQMGLPLLSIHTFDWAWRKHPPRLTTKSSTPAL